MTDYCILTSTGQPLSYRETVITFPTLERASAFCRPGFTIVRAGEEDGEERAADLIGSGRSRYRMGYANRKAA